MGLLKVKCCLVRSPKDSGVMLCRVAKVCVLGSRSGPGVSLSGALWRDGDEECCPGTWRKLDGGGYCGSPCG